MSIIHDFKSIRRKLERQEQKAEFEAKSQPIAWTPEHGYLTPSEFNDAARNVMGQMANARPR
jgi:hypothetical protein